VTRYYLSLDTVRDGSDVALSPTRSVPMLVAGANSPGGATVTVPGGTPANRYFVLACADDATVVAESNETNQCLASATTVQVTAPSGQPDLVVSALSEPPASAVLGASLTVTDTTINAGGAATTVSTWTRYYLSPDPVRDASDKQIYGGARSIGPLAAGASTTGSRSTTIPDGLTPGSYYLIACTDQPPVIAEGDETNNCRASTGTVLLSGADLTTTAVSSPPGSVVAGGSFGVTDTTANTGNAATAVTTTVRYYLSTDAVRNAGDRLLTGTRSVAPLAAGGSAGGSATVTVPSTTPAGTYFFLACADDTFQVFEIAEGNNCRTAATTVTVTP
jgi:subtilase family serine protease